jgi:tryptophanyl-tRNA synthetase
MTTYLSGIQSSGRQHFGNYFGAIQNHIALVGGEAEDEYFYFIPSAAPSSARATSPRCASSRGCSPA